MIELPDIKNIDIDLKAELLATILYERYQLSLNQIVINSFFWHQRPGRNDVVGWNEERYSERIDGQIITLESSRESLYDSLPEGLFIDLDKEINDDKVAVTSDDAEMHGRKILLPFQQLFFWLSILVEINSQYLEENVINIVIKKLGVERYSLLSNKINRTLISISPYLNIIVGNLTLTQGILSFLLEVEVEIYYCKIRIYELPASIIKQLGSARIRKDFCLGNIYNEGTKELIIKLNKLKPDEILGYLPAGSLRLHLEDEILPYLLPLEVPYTIEIAADNMFKGCVTDNGNYLLGYTFTI